MSQVKECRRSRNVAGERIVTCPPIAAPLRKGNYSRRMNKEACSITMKALSPELAGYERV
jgi:hypothetical protein